MLLTAGLLLGAARPAEAQVIGFRNINAPIPDGDATGLVDVRTVAGPAAPILDVNVSLVLNGLGEGGFNGDLYVGLQHEAGYAVLLNRVGRRGGSLSGYADSGFSLTLDDEAVAGDVHAYRLTLAGSHAAPLDGPLTGSWAPDARNADPDFVLDSSLRGAGLEVFRGASAAGSWVLFVADLETGGQMRLDAWSLEVRAVPEPGGVAVLAALSLLGLVGRRFASRAWGSVR